MKEIKLKLHPCYCGGEMEIKKVAQNGGMDGTYWNWELTCKKCGLTKTYAADGFYGRPYKTFEEVVDDWNRRIRNFNMCIDIKQFIEEHYTPVEDKPGYVWLNRRNYQIIKVETLAESLKAYYSIKCGEEK